MANGAVSGLSLCLVCTVTPGATLEGFKGQKARISGHIELRRLPGKGIALLHQTVTACGNHNAVELQRALLGSRGLFGFLGIMAGPGAWRHIVGIAMGIIIGSGAP